MSTWMIARSKTSEATLSAGAAAGAREFALDNADSLYAPGDPLFISNADNSAAEYLGPVAASDTSGFATAFATRLAKAPGALLWKPAARLALDAEPDTGTEILREPGFVFLQTIGGGTVAVQTRAPIERIDFALKGLTPASCDALEAWLRNEADGGSLPFTLVSSSRELMTVRWIGERTTRKEAAAGRIALRIPLVIIGHGRFE